jgi:hypothetical protein
MMATSFLKQSLSTWRMSFGSVGSFLKAVDRSSHWHFDQSIYRCPLPYERNYTGGLIRCRNDQA